MDSILASLFRVRAWDLDQLSGRDVIHDFQPNSGKCPNIIKEAFNHRAGRHWWQVLQRQLETPDSPSSRPEWDVHSFEDAVHVFGIRKVCNCQHQAPEGKTYFVATILVFFFKGHAGTRPIPTLHELQRIVRFVSAANNHHTIWH